MKNTNAHLREGVLEVVENQLRDDNPPETRRTLARLVKDGHSEAEAKNLIASVVASEIYGVMKEGGQFDQARFQAALKRLPSLPWDEE